MPLTPCWDLPPPPRLSPPAILNICRQCHLPEGDSPNSAWPVCPLPSVVDVGKGVTVPTSAPGLLPAGPWNLVGDCCVLGAGWA